MKPDEFLFEKCHADHSIPVGFVEMRSRNYRIIIKTTMYNVLIFAEDKRMEMNKET